MPIGYLVTVVIVAWCAALALAPPPPRQSSPSNLSYWFGFVINELPFHSLRRGTVGQGIEAFAAWVRARI